MYTERSDPIDTGKWTTEKLTIALLLSTSFEVSGHEHKAQLTIMVACFSKAYCCHRIGKELYLTRVKVWSGHYY